MITITQPEKFAKLIVPEIRAINGSYFFACQTQDKEVTPEYLQRIATLEFGLQQNEMSVNHVHIFDLISHEAPFSEEESAGCWDTTHPDFIFGWELAKQLARAWNATLATLFPDQPFVVYATKLNDPIVRFYRRRDTDLFGESTDAYSMQIAADEVLVLTSNV